ncbi:nuclear transport factor 2 family protein [Mycobacterium sp. SVM_VP21]|nr:nuclear transport factor 2 family protein [Mycobacterium sp. SVM_VP21]
MARSPQEIFDHHIQALLARDVDELLVDYTDDSALITAAGVAQGTDGIRAAFSQLAAALADATFEIKSQTYSGNVLLLEWTLDARGPRGFRVDGVDTFLFDDDSIRVQTISQQVRPKS